MIKSAATIEAIIDQYIWFRGPKIADVISLSPVFMPPGMLKDVEDELQRKVKVFVLDQFKPTCFQFNEILLIHMPFRVLH